MVKFLSRLGLACVLFVAQMVPAGAQVAQNTTAFIYRGITAPTQPTLTGNLTIANTTFTNNELIRSKATQNVPVTSGTYNTAATGTGLQVVIFATGGVIGSILSVAAGGTGYLNGDTIRVAGGNLDAIIRVTNEVGGVVQAGGVQLLYGGTGYTTGAQLGVQIPPVVGNETVVYTGTLTGNVTVIQPAATFLTASRQVIYVNNTTGAFTLTVFLSNGSGGTIGNGIVIPQGSNHSCDVYGETDGVNDIWYAATPVCSTAASGANSNITSLTGLTTPLSVAQGGTGVTTSTGSGSTVRSASPALTGTPTAPTQTTSDNSTDIATDQFVQSNLGSYLTTASAASTYLPINNPTSTGTLTAPIVSLGSSGSFANWSTTSPVLNIPAATLTDNTGSGTIALRGAYTINAPTLAASSAETLTAAATLYLQSPVAGTNTTIGSSYSLETTGAILSLGGVTGMAIIATGTALPSTGLFRPATNQLGFSTASTSAGFIDANQHWRIGGVGVPTISANACGSTTQGTIAASGNDQSFQVTVGTAAVTSCTITFASAFTTAPRAAVFSPANAAAAAVGTTVSYVSALGTTSLTITGTALAGASYYIHVY